jgi:hypothetical protein
MSLSNNYVPVKELGDGVTTIFTGPWNPVTTSAIKVALEDVTTGVQTPVTTGIVKELLSTGGFRVTFTVAPANTKYVVITRATTEDQTVPYKTSKGFDGSNIEGSFDKLTAIAQEEQEEIDRSLKFAPASGFSGLLPTPVVDTVLVWATTGGDVKNGPSLTEISNAATYAAEAQAAAIIAQASEAIVVDLVGTLLAEGYYSPASYGGVGDGVADDTAAVQAALNAAYAAGWGTVIIDHNKTYRVTGATFYDSNINIRFRGYMLNDYNNGIQFALCGRNYDDDLGARQSNVGIYFEGGGILASALAGTPSRKLLGLTMTDNIRVFGVTTGGSNNLGSYNVHVRGCTKFLLDGGNIKCGDSTGEDGVHISRNCSGGRICNLDIESGDDAFSITHEGLSSNAYVINGILVSNCSFKTKNNSALKLLVDTGALGAKIFDIELDNVFLGIHDGAGAGGAIFISGPAADLKAISGVTMNNVITDCTGGTYGGNSNSITNCTNIHLGNIKIKNTNSRGVLWTNCFDCSMRGFRVSDPQVDPTRFTGTIDTITFVSGNTARLHFSGAPDMSAIVGVSNIAVVIPAGPAFPQNVGIRLINSVDNTAKTMDIAVDGNTYSAAFNEVGLAVVATVSKRTLEHISVSGGARIKIDGGTIDNCGTSGIRVTQASSVSASDIEITNNTFVNCSVSYCMDIAGMVNSMVFNNRAVNCAGRQLINESNSSVNENNTYQDNFEDANAAIHNSTSYVIPRASSRDRRNRGTNNSRLFGTITVAAGATTGTLVASLNGTNPYTRASPSANLTASQVTILPSSTWAAVDTVKASWSGTTLTLTTDQVPGGAGASFDVRLDADGGQL